MAIVSCPSCGKRISDQYTICPHCDAVLGEIDPAERALQAKRKRRRQFYKARMTTFFAMTLVLLGMLWWWIDGQLELVFPPPPGAVGLMTLGIAVYLVAWGYILWLRWYSG